MHIIKILEMILKVQKSVRKSPSAENLHHAETSKPTCNANLFNEKPEEIPEQTTVSIKVTIIWYVLN